MNPRRRPINWGVMLTVAYGGVCVVVDLMLMRSGTSAADLGFIATWQAVFYLGGCGIALGVVPLLRRYTKGRPKG
ncbi:MAG: hypothetical protein ABIO39_01620 [Caulobacteraceae bacterium]